ncbi:hypothetical protein GA0070616_4404 [Micromonospora nigra]|uniref:Uncharacterized protein n=1 Tax=Micromonospora nigra TaxID=145857 RepID=A0A1C6SS66_9ACTN|nr:hypothetical protein [Micromonospora nigra]SCL32192.1 hypothetical protein GA0070616_4404 [Micromonospora nigra]
MSITRDLIEGAALVSPIALGVGLLLLVRPPADADQHDLSDYMADTVQPEPGGPALRLRMRSTTTYTADILPPAPPGTQVHLPAYADTVVAQSLARYGGCAEDIAARWLRELGEQARARMAGVR